MVGTISKYYFSFLLISGLSFHSFSQDRLIDSLKLALKKIIHDTTRCNILSELAETAEDDEWPVFNEQLKILAEKNIKNNSEPKIIYQKHLASALNNIGFLIQQKGEISEALVYFNKSLQIFNEIEYKPGLATSLNNLGFISQNQGDIISALNYFYNSLKILEIIGDKNTLGTTLNNIGAIYDNQGDVSKALEYYQKSLKNYLEIGDKSGITTSLNNISGIYFKNNNADKALQFLNKSLKIQEEIGDKNGMAYSLNNIGVIYNKQNNTTKAFENWIACLKISEEIENKQWKAESLINLANLMLENGQINKAILFANKGMQTSLELGFPRSIKNSALSLKHIYTKQGNYKDAFKMYELEIKMRDSIINEETQKATIKQQLKYTYEKKELEVKAEQDKKDIVSKAELKQKEKERNYFIAGFVLVFVFALLVFRGYRQKQKANLIIAAQKKLVDEKQKEILDSIHYAKRIQSALMPSEKYISKNLNRTLRR